MNETTKNAIIEDENFEPVPCYLIVLDDNKFVERCLELQSDAKITKAMRQRKLYIIKSQLAQSSTKLDFVFLHSGVSVAVPLLGVLYQQVGLSSTETRYYCPTDQYIPLVTMRRISTLYSFLRTIGAKKVTIVSNEVNRTTKTDKKVIDEGGADLAIADGSASRRFDSMTNKTLCTTWTYCAPTQYSFIDKCQDHYFIDKYESNDKGQGILMRIAEDFCKNKYPTMEFFKLQLIHDENLQEARTLAGNVGTKLGVEFNGTSLNSVLQISFFTKDEFKTDKTIALSNKIDDSPDVKLMKDQAISIAISRIELGRCPGNEDQQQYLVAGLKDAGKTEFIKSVGIAVKGHLCCS